MRATAPRRPDNFVSLLRESWFGSAANGTGDENGPPKAPVVWWIKMVAGVAAARHNASNGGRLCQPLCANSVEATPNSGMIAARQSPRDAI